MDKHTELVKHHIFARPLGGGGNVIVEQEITQSIQSIKNSDEKIQTRYLLTLRKSLIELTEVLKMPKERKCYLVHEIGHTHSIDELVALVIDVNANQALAREELDLIVLSKTINGIQWIVRPNSKKFIDFFHTIHTRKIKSVNSSQKLSSMENLPFEKLRLLFS